MIRDKLQLAALPILLLTACVTDQTLVPDAPTEILDQATGATITSVDKPLIFGMERRDLAANARDYVTLAAVSVNRSGNIHYVLLTYIWSTVDKRNRDMVAGDAIITLLADDRRIRLTSSGRTATQQGISMPLHEPPGPALAPVVYETDLETLRFIGAARNLELQTGADTVAPRYTLWDDNRASLAQFVRYLRGERSVGEKRP